MNSFPKHFQTGPEIQTSSSSENSLVHWPLNHHCTHFDPWGEIQSLRYSQLLNSTLLHMVMWGLILVPLRSCRRALEQDGVFLSRGSQPKASGWRTATITRPSCCCCNYHFIYYFSVLASQYQWDHQTLLKCFSSAVSGGCKRVIKPTHSRKSRQRSWRRNAPNHNNTVA